MKIIVPMAGIGSRLRPHTLTIPKSLTVIAGKPIVHRLVEDIAKGQVLTNQNIKRIRPGFGLHPKHFHSALGKISNKDLKKGDRLTINDFD